MFRETSFQQVLLSSSGPKENIFQAILYTLEVYQKMFSKIFLFMIFFNFYIGLVLLSYIVTDVKSQYFVGCGQMLLFSDTPKGYTKLLGKIFSLGPDEDRRTC